MSLYHSTGFGKYTIFDLSNKNIGYSKLSKWCWDRWPTDNNDWILEYHSALPSIYLYLRKGHKFDLTEFKLTWL